MPRGISRMKEIEKLEDGLPWLFLARAGEWIPGNNASSIKIERMSDDHIRNAINIVRDSRPHLGYHGCMYESTQDHYDRVANEKINQLERELFFRDNGYHHP